MKNSKKVVLLLVVIMLVAAMCLALAACGEDPSNPGGNTDKPGGNTDTPGGNTDTPGGNTDTPGGNTDTPGGETGKALSANDLNNEAYAAEAGVVKEISAFASQYITNYAIESADNTKNLQSAINSKIKGSKVVSKVTVSLEQGKYSLAFEFKKDNATYAYTDVNLTAKAKNDGNYAGYEIQTQSGTKPKFDASFANVYNAAIKTVADAIDKGTVFGDAYKDAQGNVVFSLSAHALFEFSYGAMTKPVTYGLAAEGTLGRYAKDTNAKIEVIDESNNKVLVGLYYIGNEKPADCKFYVSLEFDYTVVDEKTDKETTKTYKHDVYLANADINALLANVLDKYFDDEIVREHNCKTFAETSAHLDGNSDNYCDSCGKYICNHVDIDPTITDDKADCKCYKCGASMHVDADNNNKCDACGKLMDILKASNYKSFGAVLKDLGLGSTGSLVSSLLNTLVTATEVTANGTTRYQYSLDIEKTLAELLKNQQIADAAAGLVSNLTANIEFLKDFDLASFKGVGGTLLITADVKDGKLTGVQLSYNVAEKDFRWSKNDADPKIYGPVNVAITAKDVAIGDTAGTISLKKDAKYVEFNPLSGEISADVTITTKSGNAEAVTTKYALDAKAYYNAFALGLAGIGGKTTDVDGAAEIVLTDVKTQKAYLHVWIHNLTYTVDDKGNGTWDSTVDVLLEDKYYTIKASESDFFKNLGDTLYNKFDKEETIISSVKDYVMELIEQFKDKEQKAYTQDDFVKYQNEMVAKVRALEAGDGTTSKWLDEIKSNAVNAIMAVKYDANKDIKQTAEILKIYEEAKDAFNEQVKWENRTGVGAFDGFDLMALISNFGKLKDFFTAGTVNDKTFYTLTLGGTNIWDVDWEAQKDFTPALMMDLNADVYNAVIELLKPALPNLPTFTDDAATVVVHMNDTAANDSQLHAEIVYKSVTVNVDGSLKDLFDANGKVKANGKITGKVTVKVDNQSYVFDLTIQLNDWLDANGNVNPNGGITATLDVNIKGEQYKYELALQLQGWTWTDANKAGSATVTFKEADKATNMAYQTFVTAVLSIENGGFELDLKLASRNPETNALNTEHHYVISGSADGDNKVVGLTFKSEDKKDAFTISLGGEYNGLNDEGYLPFGIPDPIVGFDLGVEFNGNKLDVNVDNLTIANWTQTQYKEIKGFDTSKYSKANQDAAGFDSAMVDAVVTRISPYLFTK